MNYLNELEINQNNMPRPRLLLYRLILSSTAFSLLYLLHTKFQTIVANFLYLPLYFHTLLLINLGIWCWATNMHWLWKSGIDVNILFNPTNNSKNDDDDEEAVSPVTKRGYQGYYLYNMALVYSLISLFGFIYFEIALRRKLGVEKVDWNSVTEEDRHSVEYIPMFVYIGIFAISVMPFGIFYPKQRFTVVRLLHYTR